MYKHGQYSDVYCLYNGQQVSSSYLKQNNSYDFLMVTNKLNTLKYTNSSWEDNSAKKEKGKKKS